MTKEKAEMVSAGSSKERQWKNDDEDQSPSTNPNPSSFSTSPVTSFSQPPSFFFRPKNSQLPTSLALSLSVSLFSHCSQNLLPLFSNTLAVSSPLSSASSYPFYMGS